ncbi:MAG: 50S ribosomal protein L29 [Phycisphaerales bacterium]|nr:50S ribosomal protein L29 [Phycisphaerales bacterium]
MKIGDLRELKNDELHAELERLRRHSFDLRSQAVTQKLEDSSLLRKTRRDIARVLTILGDRGEENIEQTQIHMESVGKPKAEKK